MYKSNKKSSLSFNRKDFILKIKQTNQNLVSNPGFENRTLRPWVGVDVTNSGSIFTTTVNPHSGSQAVNIEVIARRSVIIRQRLHNLLRGRRYRLTFWVRRVTSAINGSLQAQIHYTDIGTKDGRSFTFSSIPLGSYRQFTVEFIIFNRRGYKFASPALEFELPLTNADGGRVVIDDVTFTLLPKGS